ncbi:MAG: hypothetical protein ACI9MC_001859 [Kiritimatiellia bacterium]|jgi:hypothetical protein
MYHLGYPPIYNDAILGADMRRTPPMPCSPIQLCSLVFVALTACQDYSFNSTVDPNNPDETDPDMGTDGTDVGTDLGCDSMQADAIDVSLNDACDVGPQVGTFTPVIEWNVGGHNGFGPAVVGQLDDDNGDGYIDALDTPSLCYVQNNYSAGSNGVICFNGKTGSIELETTAGRSTIDGLSAMAIGDLDGDTTPELVVANGPNEIIVMTPDGTVKWVYGGMNNTNQTFTYPQIADLDNDGYAEVLVGRNILSWDGRLLGTGKYGVGAVPNASGSYIEASAPVAVDVNNDGTLEVVVGNAAYNIDGTAMYTNGMADGMVAVADLDLDGEPEFVVVSGNRVYTLETNLQPTGWSASFASNYIGPPAIDDLDGDGYPDFVVQARNELRAYHGDGRLMWTSYVQDNSGAAGAVLFDFEMDGYPEVLYADEVAVRVFDGRNGKVKMESNEHRSRTGFETPVVADVDGDGEAEIIMVHDTHGTGVSVYGDRDHSWAPGRQVWNQHAYSITNVNDDLSIPMNQEANWASHNNFRSGDAGLPPSEWHDVTVEVIEVCTLECPDTLHLMVRVENRGTKDLKSNLPLVVRAGPEGPAVAFDTVPDILRSGRTSTGITLEVKIADLMGEAPVVEVDRTERGFDTLAECDEDNNVRTVPSCD